MFDSIRRAILKNLAIGLLTLIPLFGTFYVIVVILNFSDNFLFNLLPYAWRPRVILGFDIPGLGLALTICIIGFAGVFMRNFFGRQIYSWVEGVIQRIPLMNTMYSAFRQFAESIFMDRSNAFRKVVVVEYPRKGIYTLAFVTSISKNSTKYADAYSDIYSVFVPTTPNPTSGFFLVLPDWAVHDVDMTVQEAFRLIVSGGLLAGTNNILPRIEAAIAPSLQESRRE